MSAELAPPPNNLVGRLAVPTVTGDLHIFKRLPDARHNAGLWEFPGGSVEVNQTSQDTGMLYRNLSAFSSLRISRNHPLRVLAEEASLRETEEESGLKVALVCEAFLVEFRRMEDGPEEWSMYTLFGGVAKVVGGEAVASSEHAARAPVPLDLILKHEDAMTPQSFLMAQYIKEKNLLEAALRSL